MRAMKKAVIIFGIALYGGALLFIASLTAPLKIATHPAPVETTTVHRLPRKMGLAGSQGGCLTPSSTATPCTVFPSDPPPPPTATSTTALTPPPQLNTRFSPPQSSTLVAPSTYPDAHKIIIRECPHCPACRCVCSCPAPICPAAPAPPRLAAPAPAPSVFLPDEQSLLYVGIVVGLCGYILIAFMVGMKWPMVIRAWDEWINFPLNYLKNGTDRFAFFLRNALRVIWYVCLSVLLYMLAIYFFGPIIHYFKTGRLFENPDSENVHTVVLTFGDLLHRG